MPEEKLWTRTYYTRDQVPICPVFTRAKLKSRFGILKNLPSHYYPYTVGQDITESLLAEISSTTVHRLTCHANQHGTSIRIFQSCAPWIYWRSVFNRQCLTLFLYDTDIEKWARILTRPPTFFLTFSAFLLTAPVCMMQLWVTGHV